MKYKYNMTFTRTSCRGKPQLTLSGNVCVIGTSLRELEIRLKIGKPSLTSIEPSWSDYSDYSHPQVQMPYQYDIYSLS